MVCILVQLVYTFLVGLGNYWSNTIINYVHFPAPRIQFFAIEIARNREGYNKAVYIRDHDKEGVKTGGEEEGKKGADSEEEDKVEKRAQSRGEEGVTREEEK